MKRILEFHKLLLQPNSGVSSKRYISILSLYIFYIIIIIQLFVNPISDSVINAFLILIIGSNTLTLLQKKEAKNEV